MTPSKTGLSPNKARVSEAGSYTPVLVQKMLDRSATAKACIDNADELLRDSKGRMAVSLLIAAEQKFPDNKYLLRKSRHKIIDILRVTENPTKS